MNTREQTAESGQRIQKVLANAGVGSRRQVEDWIRNGRLTVNDRPAQLGQPLAPTDKVRLDGRAVRFAAPEDVRRRVILYRKPAGQVVTRRDPEGRDTVFRHLPRVRNGRWIAVGRLDVNTSGLLILTTDGELAKRLMHPRYGIEREYAVRVYGEVTSEMLQRLCTGVELDDGPARFDRIQAAGGDHRNQWYHVTLHEGRTREVRRLWESQDVSVSRLIRVRFGPCVIPTGTKVGKAYELSEEEMEPLLQAVGLQSAPKQRSRTQRTQRNTRRVTRRR